MPEIDPILQERDRIYTAALASLKELIFDRFASMDTANQLKAEELARRLDVLNHAHEQAREKERDFISREVYDKQVERIADDIKALSHEIKTAAEPVASALVDQDKRNNERFGKIENAQSRMAGGLVLAAFIVPTLTGLLTFLIAHH